MIQESATLAINSRIRAKQAAGEPVLHLGFGEAGLPVLPVVTEVLASASGRNAYGSVAGALDARRAAAGYLGRRGLPTDPDQIVLAPGSKPLLFGLVAAMPGDVVLPCPSWVSYAAQAALMGDECSRCRFPSPPVAFPIRCCSTRRSVRPAAMVPIRGSWS